MFERMAEGRTDLVFEYLAAGHAADASEGGVSLMQWCAYHGDVSAIRFLISRGASLDALGPNLDLNGAVFHGHRNLCEFVIENGADVNHPMPGTAETPLHSALCKANRPAYDAIVKLLLDHGANPNCATMPNVETDSFMRDCRTKGETPLHRAAAFGTEISVQLLLDAGAVIDAKDMNGETPLSWASWHLRPPVILRKLCYGGISVHSGNRSTYDHGRGW
jgi:ankyrin repeat protein